MKLTLSPQTPSINLATTKKDCAVEAPVREVLSTKYKEICRTKSDRQELLSLLEPSGPSRSNPKATSKADSIEETSLVVAGPAADATNPDTSCRAAEYSRRVDELVAFFKLSSRDSIALAI